MTPKEIVQSFYANLAKGDRESAFNLLDKNFILKQASSLPYGGEYKGSEALAGFFKKFNGYWKEFKTLSTEFHEVENKVFAISIIQGKNHQNRSIKTEMIQIYETEDQKIIFAQPFYFDTALILER